MPRILILITTAAQFVWGAEIRGRVLDPDRAAVSQAAVALYAPTGAERRNTHTNSTGDFVFSGLPAGDYLLTAESAGFASTGPVSVTAREGAAEPVTLLLALGRVSQRVVVTASSTPLSVDANAKAVDIVDYADMRNRGEFSITEVLRQIPGMRVQQLGGPGAFARLHTRGLRAADTAVLIDGFRLRDAASPQGDATAFLSDLLVINPSRVEVLRGTGSSLYGSNAVAGVVHVVTDPGGGPLHGELSTEGGGLGMFRGLARASGGAFKERLQFSAGLGHLNVTRGVDGDDRARNTSGQGFAQYRLSARSRATARLLASDTFAGLNLTPFAAPAANLPAAGVVGAVPLPYSQLKLAEAGLPYVWETATFAPSLNDPDSRRAARQVSFLAGFIHQLRPAATLRFSYQHLSTRRDNRDGPAGPRFQPRFNNSALFAGEIDNAQLRIDTQLGRHHLLTAGHEFENERFENVSRDENPNPASRVFARTKVRQRSHAVFAQDQIRLLDGRLLASLSGRWQAFQLEQPTFEGGSPGYRDSAHSSPPQAWTGDASLAYMLPASGTKLRAHFGNAYRAPALYERFGTFFFGGAFSPLGDPRLSPERSVAFDFGADQYLSASRARVSATFFYTRLQQVIGFGALRGLDPFGRFSGYLNTGGGLARGIELSGEAALGRATRLAASYTHTRSLERTPLFAGILRSPRIPTRMGTVLLSRRIGKRLDVTADFQASGIAFTPMFAGTGTRAFAFPGSRKFDAAVLYTIPLTERGSLQIFTRIDNLLNHTWYEDGFRIPRAWAVGGLKLLF
jgi:iron complex outermembrane receptor protein